MKLGYSNRVISKSSLSLLLLVGSLLNIKGSRTSRASSISYEWEIPSNKVLKSSFGFTVLNPGAFKEVLKF